MDAMVERLQAISLSLKEAESQRLLEAVRASMERRSFHVAVLGEFKRGKSSFVNALLGRELLRTDILPATAVLHMLEYGEDESYEIVYQDGTVKAYPLDPAALAELAVGGSVPPETVRWVRLRLNHPMLKDGMVLIDTPGVNDMNAARAEVTYTILPGCDAALFLLDAAAPLTRSEADFLQTKVLHHKVNDLVFLLAKSDRLDDEELVEALEGASKRVHEVVGRPVAVVPFSSREAVAALEAGHASSSLAGLFEQLDGLRAKAAEGKDRRHAERLLLAVDELLTAAGWQEAAHQSNALLLDEHRGRLARVMDEANIRFERLLAGVDTVGRDGLSVMMEQAYRKLEDMLLYDLQYDVKTRGGALERMMERDVPLQIERTLRQFSESKSFEIQLYLQRFQDHIAAEYVKHFNMPLALALEETGIRMPAWQADVGQEQQNQVSAVIRYAAPATALAIVGSLVMPGIGTVIGGAVGGILSTAMRSKQTEELRAHVLEQLPGIVHDIVSRHRSETRLAMDGWFEQMKTSLRAFHDRQIDRLRAVVESNVDEPELAQTAVTVDELGAYRDELHRYRRQLQAMLAAGQEASRP